MLSDNFDDANTMSCWSRLHQVENRPAQYTLLDIDSSNQGQLTLEPVQSAWYMNGVAPLVFKQVTGDFVVETQATALERTDVTQPASQAYHSAGLLVRDPASMSGAQNWLMYNLGYQANNLGSEGKTTVNSNSTLYLIAGHHTGRLRVCRIGALVRMYRRWPGENSWTLEHTFTRPDLPATLQAGMIVNAWQAPANLQARFDYVRYGQVQTAGDCVAPINPI